MGVANKLPGFSLKLDLFQRATSLSFCGFFLSRLCGFCLRRIRPSTADSGLFRQTFVEVVDRRVAEMKRQLLNPVVG